MKANRNCSFAAVLVITLNGKNMVETGKCLGANEDTGEVLMMYQNARGAEVPDYDAEMNALVADRGQVIVLKGEVKISVSPVVFGTCSDFFGYESEAALLEAIAASWKPIDVLKKVPVQCKDADCKAEHWNFEPAFQF